MPNNPHPTIEVNYTHSDGFKPFEDFAVKLKNLAMSKTNGIAVGEFSVSLLKEDEPILHEYLLNNALGHKNLTMVDLKICKKPCHIFTSNMKHTFTYTVKLFEQHD